MSTIPKNSPTVKDDSNSNPSEDEAAGEMTWSRPAFEKLRLPSSVKPQFIRKKRVHSASFSHSGVNGVTIDGVPSDIPALTAALHKSHVSSTRVLHGKNSKKSRDGRRIPSKRGGKNSDKPAQDLDEISIDHDDPNYDSDSEDPVIFASYSPAPPDEAFERKFSILINELFVHGKTQEVVDVLAELNPAPHQRRRIPYLAITAALQHKQTQCELTSELLSDLYGKVINQAHVQQGFALVLQELGEITIDFPKASEHVARFIARALADDILPPKFIEYQKSVHSPLDPKDGNSPPGSAPPIGGATVDRFGTSAASSNGVEETGSSQRSSGGRNFSDSHGRENGSSDLTTNGTSVSSGIGSASSLAATPPAVLRSDVALSALIRSQELLTLSHAFSRLDNIWGVPIGPKTTKVLVKKIQGLLKTYFDSNELDVATETLVELDSPHFHHELVFQSIIMAIELSTDEARARVIRLLKELCHSVVITSNQLTLGVRRVYSELPDLQLDVPAAYVLMDRILKDGFAAGFITKSLMVEMPVKQRKRFISETDSIYRSAYRPL